METIKIYKGNTPTLRFKLSSNGTPLPIGDGKVIFAAKAFIGSETYEIGPKLAEIDNGPFGEVSLKLSRDETLRSDTIVSEIEYRSNDGDVVMTMWRGELMFIDTVIDELAKDIDVTISGIPKEITSIDSIDLKITNIDVEEYKFKLDEEAWSDPIPIGERIEMNGLDEGKHELYIMIKKNNIWEEEYLAEKVAWTIVPIKAALMEEPINGSETTFETFVSGIDLKSYSYKIDNEEWSDYLTLDYTLLLENLAVGEHTLLVVGKNSKGKIQDEPSSFKWEITA